jgi:hypothetical protein
MRSWILFFSVVAISVSPAETLTDSEIELRQHLVSFFQRGGSLEALPSTHPLRPLVRLPLTATTSYMLLGEDEGVLARFYPEISRIVFDRLNQDNLTDAGLLPGSAGDGDVSQIYLSPTLNALACLELHCLHLIAFRIGNYEDAFELLSWSNRMAETTTRTFYDPSRNFFFPLDNDGYLRIGYSAGQALPLLLDHTIGSAARNRISEKFRNPEIETRLWEGRADESLQPVIACLLRFIPEIGQLERQPPIPAGGTVWARFWTESAARPRGLFPPSHHISSLMHLVHLLERESIMEQEVFEPLDADTDSLVGFLSAGTPDIDSYINAIGTVNRLLGFVSQFSSNIDRTVDRWRVVREYAWSRLSPRQRRILKESAKEALDELRLVKPVLSARFMERSDFVSRIVFPSSPVSRSRQIDYTASLLCGADSLSISRLYIGIGEQRWKITEDGVTIPLSPRLEPFTHRGVLMLPPTTVTGIHRLPVYFDFLASGRRVELHHLESITLTEGYDVSLTFPDGKRLTGESISLDIIMRVRPDHMMQGRVEGTFMKELHCSPELPARFVLREQSDVTTLPLTISFGDGLPPGQYPFSLRVILDGKQVAFFEETLVKPIRWFHLGPLEGNKKLLERGVSYQDDLFSPHAGPGGHAIEWREIPSGALDIQGAVLPSRLIGTAPYHCSLFYTALFSEGRQKAVWGLTTRNTSSLWINGEPAITSAVSPYGDKTGKTDIRKGVNSVFLVCCWDESPDRVLLTLSDESGLPLPGLNNEIERIVEGYDRLAAPTDEIEPEAEGEDKPIEVTLTLEYPDAQEVSVIGTFNNWEAGDTPMQRGEEGIWTVRFFLRAGRYTYKFLVDGKIRLPDPNSSMREADGFGGENSVLIVR